MKTTKIFKRDNCQAARPPKKITYERILAAVSQFKGTIERHQPKDHFRCKSG